MSGMVVDKRAVCLRVIRRGACGGMLFDHGAPGVDPWVTIWPWTDDVSEATCRDCLRVWQPGLL